MSEFIEAKRFSHSLTRLIGALAALVLLAVSAAMNYLFLFSLGKTPIEAHVLGAASAAADLLKAVLPFLILWAWRAGRLSVALPGLLVWIVFCVFSLLSAIGFAAGNRAQVTDARTALAERYEMVRSNLKAAEEERERLPKHRAVEIVAAAIDAHKQHRRWASTTECTNATVPDSRAYCRDYFALQAELVAARKNAALAETIKRLRTQAAALREAGGHREPEPQIGLLSYLLGLERDPVRLVLILLIAGLVELGAGLGLYLSLSGTGPAGQALRHQRQGRQGKATAARSDANSPGIGEVADFAWACLQPAKGSTLSEKALFAAYQRWCAGEGGPALGELAFAKAFAELAAGVGIEREHTGYRGIRIIAPCPSE